MSIVAKTLFDKILEAFPELQSEIVEGDEELPYMMMMHLSAWIAARNGADMTHLLSYRIIDFTKWCENQPRGVDAGDDIFTILWVGFYEKLFRSEVGRELLPRLIEREDFEHNAEYLKRDWVPLSPSDFAQLQKVRLGRWRHASTISSEFDFPPASRKS